MALFKLDITKLTTSATWQVIISVVIISATSFVGQQLTDRKDTRKIDKLSGTMQEVKMDVRDISGKQGSFSDDIADIKRGQGVVVANIGKLKADIRDMQTKQDEQNSDLADVVTLFRNQGKFTPKQMELLLDTWLKKNGNRIVLGETPMSVIEYTADNQK